MGRVKDKYEARKLEILLGATAVFAQRGFSDTTMDEIGEALNMTKGNLYYYFRSKQDLLYFCQRYSLNRLIEGASRITSSGEPFPLQLYRLIGSQADCMLNEVGGSVAHVEFRRLPGKQLGSIIRRRNEYESILRQVVADGIQEGSFYPDTDPRMAVWMILGALNWMVQWFSPGGSFSAADIGHYFSLYLVRGLTRPEFHSSLPEDSERRAETDQSLPRGAHVG